MNRIKFTSILAIFTIILSPCALAGKPKPPRQEPDVVVLASPIRVKELQPKAVVDAIENPEHAEEPKALVLFKIDRILRGTLPKTKLGGPSKWEQAKEAVQDKSYFKLLGSDYTDSERIIDKEWLSVAVADPAKTFAISSWENPGGKQYQIRLRPVPGKTGSYVMVESRLKN